MYKKNKRYILKEMPQRTPNFLLVGLGFISSRHLEAIHKIGGTVGARLDIDQEKESSPSKEGLFFYNPISLELSGAMRALPYVSICTPNDTHLELAKRFHAYGAHILVEKPAALSVAELQAYAGLDRVRFVLQLRYEEQLQALQQEWQEDPPKHLRMEFHVNRSDSYKSSWKTDPKRSGGVLFNIGFHYFDLMTWFFGEPTGVSNVTGDDVSEISGTVQFKNTTVDFSFSLKQQANNQTRALIFGDTKLDLMPFFLSHHTDVYKDFVEGRGFTWQDCLTTTRLIESIKHDSVLPSVT